MRARVASAPAGSSGCGDVDRERAIHVARAFAARCPRSASLLEQRRRSQPSRAIRRRAASTRCWSATRASPRSPTTARARAAPARRAAGGADRSPRSRTRPPASTSIPAPRSAAASSSTTAPASSSARRRHRRARAALPGGHARRQALSRGRPAARCVKGAPRHPDRRRRRRHLRRRDDSRPHHHRPRLDHRRQRLAHPQRAAGSNVSQASALDELIVDGSGI